jgi:thioredoxin reductase (NADPH)
MSPSATAPWPSTRHGAGRLSGLTLKDRTSGATETVPATALFILIGAQPHTGWLPDTLRRDR